MAKARLAIIGTVAALSLGALAACSENAPGGAAQNADPSDQVMATVNGTDIYRSDIDMIAEMMGPSAMQIPAAQRDQEFLRILVDLTLVAEKARAEGYLNRPEVQRSMRQAERDALYTAYLTEVTQNVPESDIQATYDEAAAAFTPEEEVSARHILVETEDEAKAIKAELEGGADFAELAIQKSTGPSGANGGDLGWFARERMVEAFSNVAFALEDGAISDPVETQFGWHIIKREGGRMSAMPPLEDVRDAIISQLIPQKISEELESLREGAKIEYANENNDSAEVETVDETPAAAE